MTILIISYNRFPDNDAGAVRDYMFAKMLEDLGCSVYVVAMGTSTNLEIKDYNGVKYISLRSENLDKRSRLLNYFGFTKRLIDFIENNFKNNLPDFFWIVNIPLHSSLFIKKYAIKNHIKLVHDSVEWYSPRQFKLGFLSPAFILKELNNRIIIDKNFRVIAISAFLHRYYSNKKIMSIRIPIIFDKNEMAQDKNVIDDKLVILYAGAPGKKDYLYTIIRSLTILPENILSKIEFRIIGVSKLEIKNMFKRERNVFNSIEDYLNIKGRLTRQEVLANLIEADFTVLLRNPDLRYAKAGFPVKFVESIASATPMILNISSDLGEYLDDLENCIVVEDASSISFARALEKAYDIKFIKKDIKSMQKNSRQTFETHFHYHNYLNMVSDFLTIK